MMRSTTAAAIVGMMALAAPSMANPISAGDFLRFSDGPGTVNGGEFIVNSLQSGQTIRTFCLEVPENVFFGGAPGVTHPFEVEAVSDRAVLGGSNNDPPDGGGPGDPISSRTAFLFQNFARGTLAGYNYGLDSDPARISSANALQNAIWFLEHEISDQNQGIADPATQALIAMFLTMDMGGFTGIGDVQVANLIYRVDGPGGSAGDQAQDILILVPLPHAAGLGFAGLLCVMGVRRRR